MNHNREEALSTAINFLQKAREELIQNKPVLAFMYIDKAQEWAKLAKECKNE